MISKGSTLRAVFAQQWRRATAATVDDKSESVRAPKMPVMPVMPDGRAQNHGYDAAWRGTKLSGENIINGLQGLRACARAG
jgi:hypothetical protein